MPEAFAEYIVISYRTNTPELHTTLLPAERVFSPTHRRRYRDAFERAASVYATPRLCSASLLRALVQELLCHIIRENDPHTDIVENPITYAKHYMDEYFDHPLSAQDIAAVEGCSESHLRKLFKRSFGESPIHYLNRIRVEHAKEMLSSNLFRTEEIATACGFQNVYYFSRVFKSYTGTSPGKY